MKKLTSSLCAGLLSLAMGATGLAPSFAAPIAVPTAPGGQLIQIQGPQELRGASREMRRGNRDFQRHHRTDRRLERRGNRYYFNGHRGFRDRRAGYREHNGWWFPPAAFIAGAIIGGANRAPAAVGSAHIDWCHNRYRSYRSSDNTFQPYNGPRAQCVSPYS